VDDGTLFFTHRRRVDEFAEPTSARAWEQGTIYINDAAAVLPYLVSSAMAAPDMAAAGSWFAPVPGIVPGKTGAPVPIFPFSPTVSPAKRLRFCVKIGTFAMVC
jgi:hypothetical protein